MSNEIALVEYDKACRQLAIALAEAKDVQTVKKVHGLAGAIRYYAKLAGDKQACAEAWEIRQRAELVLGKQMLNGKEDRMEKGGDRRSEDFKGFEKTFENHKPTLEELGISKGLAHRARRLAELSDKDFGLYINDGRANIQHPVENAPQLKAKPKKKAKAEREFKCPHCGKPIYFKSGEVSGFWRSSPGNSK